MNSVVTRPGTRLLVFLLLAGCAAALTAQGTGRTPTLRPLTPEVRAQAARSFATPDAKGQGQTARSLDRARVEGAAEETCLDQFLQCGQTVQGRLSASDCLFPGDGTVFDFWIFDASAGQTVSILLASEDFDSYLFLLDPEDTQVADDNDSGGGTDAFIERTLDTTGAWAIVANNLDPVSGDPGDYTLSLDCGATAPEPPAAPSNLTAATLSTTEIELGWQDNANDESQFEVQMREAGGNFASIGTVPANSEGAIVEFLTADTLYTFRVRALNAGGASPFSNQASATTDAEPEPEPLPTECVPSNTVLCFNNERFHVEVTWTDFQDNQGDARVVQIPFDGDQVPALSDDSGLLYFFNNDNWELLIKVLNGCAINDRYWVFAAAATNVEYLIRVVDTDRGLLREYANPLGNRAQAFTDTAAFDTCP